MLLLLLVLPGGLPLPLLLLELVPRRHQTSLQASLLPHFCVPQVSALVGHQRRNEAYRLICPFPPLPTATARPETRRSMASSSSTDGTPASKVHTQPLHTLHISSVTQSLPHLVTYVGEAGSVPDASERRQAHQHPSSPDGRRASCQGGGANHLLAWYVSIDLISNPRKELEKLQFTDSYIKTPLLFPLLTHIPPKTKTRVLERPLRHSLLPRLRRAHSFPRQHGG